MRTIITLSVIVLLVFVALIVGLPIATSLNSDLAAHLNLNQTQGLASVIGEKVWSFARPLLQLIIILFVLEWFGGRVGFKIGTTNPSAWDVQTIIGVLVVVSFCIAELTAIPGADTLKQVTLVVVGFYFGSRKAGSGPKENQTPPA